MTGRFSMRSPRCWVLLFVVLLSVACTSTPEVAPMPDARLIAIHDQSVFADMHAHPSRFHRRNIESIAAVEATRVCMHIRKY